MTDPTATGTPFAITGAAGERIRGNVHLPADGQGGRLPLLLVLHGFKGYKDYGFFPHLTRTLAAAGLVAVRFNFSHSGMDEDTSTFGRPDLFEKDTWSSQMEDVQAVRAAAASGELPNADRIDTGRIGLIGHSRGGATALLAAGHHPRIRAVVTMAAPAATDYLTETQKNELREKGYLVSPSARTGQNLRIGRQWLDDLEAHRDKLNLTAAVARISCPLLIVHGMADESVPCTCAKTIAAAYSGTAKQLIVEAANHTFNCANPMEHPSPALNQVLAAAASFFADHLCRRS